MWNMLGKGGGVVTAVMSEVASQLQGEFCKHAESAKQKNCCLD